MIYIDFRDGLLPLTQDICQVSEGNNGPLFSDETLSWFNDHNMTVFMEGTQIWHDTPATRFIPYSKPISEMTLGLLATTSTHDCKLVFKNESDAMLFKLTWG